MSNDNYIISKIPSRGFLAARLFSIGLAIVISITFIILSVFISIGAADHFYVLHHPMAVANKDLGLGLVVVMWASISFVVSLICVLLSLFLQYRFILKLILGHKGTPLS